VAHFALEADLSPLFILMCRFFMSAMFIGIVYAKRIRKTFRPRHLKSGILLGTIFLLAFYTQMIGLKYSTPSNNAIIMSSNVVIVPFLWWLVTKNRPMRSAFLSCGISLVGIAIISFDFSQGFTLRIGDVFSLLAAVLFAAQIVAVGEMAQRIDHCLLVFMEFATAAILAFIFFIFTDGNFASFTNAGGVLAVLYMGIVCTCICFLLQAWAMRRVNSSHSAVIMSMEALFGSLLSILVGTDKLGWRIVVGGLLLFFSVILPELLRNKQMETINYSNFN